MGIIQQPQRTDTHGAKTNKGCSDSSWSGDVQGTARQLTTEATTQRHLQYLWRSSQFSFVSCFGSHPISRGSREEVGRKTSMFSLFLPKPFGAGLQRQADMFDLQQETRNSATQPEKMEWSRTDRRRNHIQNAKFRRISCSRCRLQNHSSSAPKQLVDGRLCIR